MRNILIAGLILLTQLTYADRIETETFNFKGPITVSNETVKGIFKLDPTKIAYDDMLGPARIVVVGASDITWNDTLAGAQFDTSCTTNLNSDSLLFTYQTPHKRLTNSHLDPHMHWYQNNADQTNLFYIRYAFIGIGQTNVTETFRGPATNQIAYSGINMMQISTFPEIDGNGKGISSILRIRLYRFGSRGTGNITVTDLDCHIEVDSLGSDSELSKSF